MSAKDVDEVIDHILAEVNLFVPHYDRKMDRYIRQQHDKDPVSGFVRLVTVLVLNDPAELPSSCSRNLQAVQVQ